MAHVRLRLHFGDLMGDVEDNLLEWRFSEETNG